MVIMKKNIKLLIESLFDDDDVFDDESVILMDKDNERAKIAIEQLKQGKMVSSADLELCHEKQYQWKPADMFELKQVINIIESDKNINAFDLNWVDVSGFDSLAQLFSMCKKNYDVSKWDVSKCHINVLDVLWLQ